MATSPKIQSPANPALAHPDSFEATFGAPPSAPAPSSTAANEPLLSPPHRVAPPPPFAPQGTPPAEPSAPPPPPPPPTAPMPWNLQHQMPPPPVAPPATNDEVPLLKTQAVDAKKDSCCQTSTETGVNIDDIMLQSNRAAYAGYGKPLAQPTTQTMSSSTSYTRPNDPYYSYTAPPPPPATRQTKDFVRKPSVSAERRPLPQEWGARPCRVTCPSCGHTGETKIDLEAGTAVWLACFCLFCFCWPLMWLPFVMDDCKDVVHYCNRCNVRLGCKAAM